jgi:hypothetical protein
VRAFLLSLALLVAAMVASADPVPVIEGGREQEILALFLPHQLGREVTPGWKLWDVTVSPLAIRAECRGPGERRAAIRLIHPSGGNGVPTKSFVIQRDPAADPAGFPALDGLTRAVTENDRGNFFRTLGVPRIEASPNRTRFIAIPIVAFVVGLAGMWLTRRIRARRV